MSEGVGEVSGKRTRTFTIVRSTPFLIFIFLVYRMRTIYRQNLDFSLPSGLEISFNSRIAFNTTRVVGEKWHTYIYIYLIKTRGANARVMSALFYWSFENSARSCRARAWDLQNTRYRYRLNHTVLPASRGKRWCCCAPTHFLARLALAREIARVNCTVCYRSSSSSRQFIMQFLLNRVRRYSKATIYATRRRREIFCELSDDRSERLGSITIRNLCWTAFK